MTTTTNPDPTAGGRHDLAYVAPAFDAADVVRNVRREQAEAEALRRDVGYRDGYERGRAEARAEVEAAIADHRTSAERLAALGRALESAVDALERRDALVLEQVEDQIVAAAVELAEQLIGRELEVAPQPVVDAMARGLALAPERGTATVRVHPDDESTAREASHADLLRWRGDVAIVADGRVERGGCVLEVGDCRIDAQLGPALERLRAAR